MAYVYEQPDGSVVICSLQSSIPEGYPFSILDEIPQDRELRDAWKMGIGKIEYDLDKAKAIKIKEAKQEAADLMKVVTDKYDQSEIDTWSIQEDEARGSKPDSYLLTLETHSGIPLAELKTKIIANADNFRALSAESVGRRQKKEAACMAATTIDELKAVVF